jgi:hypothetical protein
VRELALRVLGGVESMGVLSLSFCCRGPVMVAQIGYLVAGRSRGWVMPCAVCTVHVETRSTCFLVEPQNQGQRFVSELASKPLR